MAEHKVHKPRLPAGEQQHWLLEHHHDGETTTVDASVPALQSFPLHDSQAHAWRFEPYEPTLVVLFVTFARSLYFRAGGQCQRPADLAACAYADLAGHVQYVPYPSKPKMLEHVAAHRDRIARAMAAAHVSRSDQRMDIYFGQNRFDITKEEFEWVMNEVLGCDVFDVEIVTKKNLRCGKTLPDGGIRASVPSLQAWKIAVSLVNKRVMIDRTGVWYASNEKECAAMAAFCASLCASIEDTRTKNVPRKAITAEAPTGRKRNGASPRFELPDAEGR